MKGGTGRLSDRAESSLSGIQFEQLILLHWNLVKGNKYSSD